jgi:hypothetical protein
MTFTEFDQIYTVKKKSYNLDVTDEMLENVVQ